MLPAPFALVGVDVGSGREHEPLHPLGSGGGDLDGDDPAGVVPDQGYLLEPHRVEEVDHTESAAFDGAGLSRSVGVAEADSIDAEDPVLAADQGEHVPELVPRTGSLVQQHHGLAPSRDRVVYLPGRGDREAAVHSGCGCAAGLRAARGHRAVPAVVAAAESSSITSAMLATRPNPKAIVINVLRCTSSAFNEPHPLSGMSMVALPSLRKTTL